MSRPLRVEFPGALYHLTARGNRRDDIFLSDDDRLRFLDLLGQEIEQQCWICYAYCLMDNHYHLLVETPEANLAKGMRRLNGRYTQSFNRKHKRIGHVFQGRYKSILVEKDAYLLELSRYIVLNPVRAGMVDTPEHFKWSSFQSAIGLTHAPDWLNSNALPAHFGSTQAYAKFVVDGINLASPWEVLQGQIWLGSESFRERMQQNVPRDGIENIPKTQLVPNRPDEKTALNYVAEYFGCKVSDLTSRTHRNGYLCAVYLLRRLVNLPLADVSVMFGISNSRVSQIQRGFLDGMLQNEIDELIERYKLKN